MRLNELTLNNYRNLKDTTLSFNNQVNIFTGLNGHGKTNLLEAIYCISLTKSFKTNRLNDLINFDKSSFYLKAMIYKNDYLYQIELLFDKNKRSLKINDNNESKFKDVLGLLNAVLFVPEDLMLLKGSPKLRRRLLDIELSKVYPKYLINLSGYYQILKHRNAYLKSGSIDDLVLESYDEQLSTYGNCVISFRDSFINEIQELVCNFYQMISGLQAMVSIVYLPSIELKQTTYNEALIKIKKRDVFLQQTSLGIHRDDFIVYLNDKDASLYASQGEVRCLVLAIKLALVEYIYKYTKEYPILLLDDVMSELDINRQENLLKYLNMKVQTFITTTNINNLSTSILDVAQLFLIEEGSLKEVGY